MDPRLGDLPTPAIQYLEPAFEQLGKEETRALQLTLFRQDLEWILGGNQFYQAHYGRRVRLAGLRHLDDVRTVPVVRKGDILADAADHPPYGRRLQVDESEIVEVVESSGTSGLGRERQALTAGDRELVRRAKVFQFHWVGCRKGTVVALHIPVTMAAGALWSLRALQHIESNVLRLGALDADARLRYMHEFKVEVMAASTSYIMRLEYAANEAGMDLQRDFGRLRSVYVGSGGWTVAWAQERAERWNARLFEVYGSSQRAFAFTCEWGVLRGSEPGVMHFLPHLALTEVIDPQTGEHVGHGEEGEIVITPFGQRAMPLIRYATGDRARFIAAGHCPCGRGSDGIQAGSVGRYDDMLKLKELNVWPQTIDGIVLAAPWVAEYRGDVFIDDRAKEVARVQVEFRPETPADARNGLLARLAGEIHAKVGLNFSCVEWVGPSLLDGQGHGFNADSLKIQRWTDRRIFTRNDPGTPDRESVV